MLDKLVFLVALAGTAVVYADVLVRPGMLLEPVQRWLRVWYGKATTRERLQYFGEDGTDSEMRGDELDEQWWWKPLWGCQVCVSGQFGLWGYLVYVGKHTPAGPAFHPEFFRAWAASFFGWAGRYWCAYSPFEHIAFTAFTILAAILISKWSQD